jgi:hypothetical protein
MSLLWRVEFIGGSKILKKFIYTWCTLLLVTPCSLVRRYLVSDERSASFFRFEVNRLQDKWIFYEPDHTGSTTLNLCPDMKTIAGLSLSVSSEQQAERESLVCLLIQQDLLSQSPTPIRCGPNMRAFVALATLFWGPNRDLWCNVTWSGLAGHGVGQSTQTLFQIITDVQFIGSWYSIYSCYSLTDSWVEYSWTAQVSGDNIKLRNHLGQLFLEADQS